MKRITHSPYNTEVCIYNYKDGILEGSFFNEKPEVGDVIQSVMYKFTVEVLNVISNRDARISTFGNGCNHNPKGAYYELQINYIF